MKLDKAVRRERKIQRRRYGMVVDGSGTKDYPRLQKKRSEEIKKRREEKEKLLEEE